MSHNPYISNVEVGIPYVNTLAYPTISNILLRQRKTKIPSYIVLHYLVEYHMYLQVKKPEFCPFFFS